jgi:hypothetical protein
VRQLAQPHAAVACWHLRAGIWLLLVLAAANGVFLYLLPGLADTEYAWAIKPPVNAAFIGAGFLAGTLATGLVLATATRWRTFSTLPPALWVLASTLSNFRLAWEVAAGRLVRIRSRSSPCDDGAV